MKLDPSGKVQVRASYYYTSCCGPDQHIYKARLQGTWSAVASLLERAQLLKWQNLLYYSSLDPQVECSGRNLLLNGFSMHVVCASLPLL